MAYRRTMTEIRATTPGLYPLPDRAKDELSELKGHQKHDLIDGDEGGGIETAYERAREAVIERQHDAGLDGIVEGQLRWDDMLAHPLAVHENVETRGIVRYYDNNNFYREPVVQGDLTPDGDVAAELEAAREHTDDLQAVLPGPYSLSELATDEHYDDEAAFMDAVASFLADEVAAFPDVASLWLLEPSLVTDPPGDGADERASEAIDAVAAATAGDTDVVVHTYWGAFEEKVHAHLLDADIDAVGYDLVTDHEDALYVINEYGTTDDVAFGVVDGQNTLVESTDDIRERVDWALENTPGGDPETVYATPNTGLFYLPVNRAEEKLDALGDVTMEAIEA